MGKSYINGHYITEAKAADAKMVISLIWYVEEKSCTSFLCIFDWLIPSNSFYGNFASETLTVSDARKFSFLIFLNKYHKHKAAFTFMSIPSFILKSYRKKLISTYKNSLHKQNFSPYPCA